MKRSCPSLRYYPETCLDGLRKIIKVLSLYTGCSGGDAKLVSLHRKQVRSETASASLICLTVVLIGHGRSQWPRGLRRRSLAARLLRLWVRIPLGAWIFVCCECCVLSGRGLCDGLITRPEESYRMWRVVLCVQVTSYARRLKSARGL